MERSVDNIRGVGYWLKLPIIGPIFCLLLVWVILATFPDVVDMALGVFVWVLFVAGCLAIGGNLARGGKYLLRR